MNQNTYGLIYIKTEDEKLNHLNFEERYCELVLRLNYQCQSQMTTGTFQFTLTIIMSSFPLSVPLTALENTNLFRFTLKEWENNFRWYSEMKSCQTIICFLWEKKRKKWHDINLVFIRNPVKASDERKSRNSPHTILFCLDWKWDHMSVFKTISCILNNVFRFQHWVKKYNSCSSGAFILTVSILIHQKRISTIFVSSVMVDAKIFENQRPRQPKRI